MHYLLKHTIVVIRWSLGYEKEVEMKTASRKSEKRKENALKSAGFWGTAVSSSLLLRFIFGKSCSSDTRFEAKWCNSID